VALLAFSGIFLTVQMLQLASLIINRGVEIIQITLVFLALIPTFLEMAIPLSALLGVMMAFARLSGDSEVIIMRASGIAIQQLIVPIIVFSSILIATGLYVSLVLRPWGYKTLSSTLFEIARTRTSAGLNEVVFNQLGNLTLYAESINHQSGELSGVLIDDLREREGRKVITGRTGRLTSSERDRTIRLELSDGHIHEIIGGKYILTDFNRNTLILDSSEIFNPEARQRERRSREMSLAEIGNEMMAYRLALLSVPLPEEENLSAPLPEEENLRDRVEELQLLSARDLTRRLRRLETERAMRFSMPFASLILALVALPLGIQPPRTQKTWGTGLSAALGMCVFVFYYGTLSIGVALAENSYLNSYLAVWLPNFLSLAIALYALERVSSEKWSSILDGVDKVIPKIVKRRFTSGR
jgi:lipopolysaccharide export system permease protein